MSTDIAQGSTLDVEAIQRLLPHRPPFLLVDRVTSWVAGGRLTAIKSVTMNEPFFVGHFPGHPVMPGVLILEALAQAAALQALLSMPPRTGPGGAIYLMSIDGARFRRPVVPGDRLELIIDVVRHKASVWKQSGQAVVDGQVVAEAEFMAKIADA
jgi:3-hydroxyacyl-[acyl-carrier-protein] dehydratase